MTTDREQGEAEQALLCLLPLGILTKHLGVMPEREVDVLKARFDLARDGAEITSAYVGTHVDFARLIFSLDHVRGWGQDHVSNVAQPHLISGGSVNQHVADTAQAMAHLRRADHPDIVDLATMVKIRRSPRSPGWQRPRVECHLA